jgi:hypothetical protein
VDEIVASLNFSLDDTSLVDVQSALAVDATDELLLLKQWLVLEVIMRPAASALRMTAARLSARSTPSGF